MPPYIGRVQPRVRVMEVVRVVRPVKPAGEFKARRVMFVGSQVVVCGASQRCSAPVASV